MSIAEEVLAKVEAFGSVISTNIKPSIFVQFAVGNNDLNEETPHSKNTTHATKMVVYQKKTFLSRSIPQPGIEECPVRGR